MANKVKERVCVVCGKTFLAARRTARFCSPDCYKHEQKNNPPPEIEKICMCCKKLFITRDKRRRCCSRTCAGHMNGEIRVTPKTWKSYAEIKMENRKRKVESGWRGRKMQGSGIL